MACMALCAWRQDKIALKHSRIASTTHRALKIFRALYYTFLLVLSFVRSLAEFVVIKFFAFADLKPSSIYVATQIRDIQHKTELQCVVLGDVATRCLNVSEILSFAEHQFFHLLQFRLQLAARLSVRCV